VMSWVKSVNIQLMSPVIHAAPGALTYVAQSVPTIERWASNLRIKKYLFWQDAVEQHPIGFYFGSFNPIHENHVALAQYAHDCLGVEKVFFVPNQDGNKDKESTVLPLEERLGMIRARIDGIEFFDTVSPNTSTQRWEAKANIAEAMTNKLFENFRSSGQPVLLLGEDSWNKAVIGSSRDKTTRHFIGIAKIVKSQIFVFPRAKTCEEIVNPPKPIRELTKVISDYSDPIVGLSSSMIREKLMSTNKPDQIDGLHPNVRQFIDSHNLYH